MNVIIIIVIFLFAYILCTYNSLIRKRNKVRQSASAIDVYLTQRFELIPNLVECVKGYVKYEQEMFETIAKMRESYFQNKNLKDGEILNNECNKIIAISENYPELKASEQFLELQKKLSKMESQLQAARRIYNSEVNVYNNEVQTFPSNIMAKLFNFKEEIYFQAEEQAKNNVAL